MTIYVDEAVWPYGRMMMCHMLPGGVDQLEELHAMAQKLGIARRHFQGSDKARTPHYDICKSKRAEAVKLGAVEIDRRQTVELSRKLKAELAAQRESRAFDSAINGMLSATVRPAQYAGHAIVSIGDEVFFWPADQLTGAMQRCFYDGDIRKVRAPDDPVIVALLQACRNES